MHTHPVWPIRWVPFLSLSLSKNISPPEVKSLFCPGDLEPRGEDERQGQWLDSSPSGGGRRASETHSDWRRRRERLQ
jgi:hypothetical protein